MKLQLIEQFQNYHLQVIKIIMEMIKKLCNIFSCLCNCINAIFYDEHKSFDKSPKVHFEQSYQGQKILLLALYQNENILF